MTSHCAEIDTHFPFFLSLPSVFFLWTVAVDPADILNYCGMLREAQVPGNLTPTALPSAWRRFLCPVTGAGEERRIEEIMKGIYFCFLDCLHHSSSVRSWTIPTSLSSSARMRGDWKRTLAEIHKQRRSGGMLKKDVQPLKPKYFLNSQVFQCMNTNYSSRHFPGCCRSLCLHCPIKLRYFANLNKLWTPRLVQAPQNKSWRLKRGRIFRSNNWKKALTIAPLIGLSKQSGTEEFLQQHNGNYESQLSQTGRETRALCAEDTWALSNLTSDK